MKTPCPGCGVLVESDSTEMDQRYYASRACTAKLAELSAYTIQLRDPEFIHQLVVDTYAASHWKEGMKPIMLSFALIGLYLVCERDYSGKQVQDMHGKLARQSKVWRTFPVPDTKATLSVVDVLSVDPSQRQGMIYEWAQSVWGIWRDQSADIARILDVL